MTMLPWRKRKSSESAPPAETPLQDVRYVVFDTELTSLDERTNRLLSMGAIAMQGARIGLGDQFYRVVKTDVAVPQDGVLIHKLRPADLERGVPVEVVLEEFQRFAEGAVLLGHFASIDKKVLTKELALAGRELANPVICTAKVHRWLVQQHYSEDQFHKLENIDLASLAKIYQLEVQEAHHALDDAFVTARLWQKLIHLVDARGIKTVGQLLRIGKV
jgi:DNA polymerase-3 subunit epsilon